MKEKELRWEQICEGTSRLKVYGGWMVVTYSERNEGECAIFVPDPDHRWII